MAGRPSLAEIPEAVASLLTCQCSEIIVKSHGDGTKKIRAKVFLVKEDGVYAVCKGCSQEVRLPLRWHMPLQLDSGPDLYLEK